MQPLPIPTQFWNDIVMDFISGLPKAMGHDTILVVVGRFIKYCHFLLLCHPYTTKSVVELFVHEVVCLHGFPKTIVSDRDLIFVSQFLQELFKLFGTSLKLSSGYYLQIDGQTEVVNRYLETYIRCFSGAHPKQWPRWIPWVEFGSIPLTMVPPK